MYWWKGEIEGSQEFAIIFKTRTELLNDAMAAVKELHSYKVPCLMCYEYVLGDKDYLNWIQEETKKN
jgi:periplasmic divalent cation tolerance protein